MKKFAFCIFYAFAWTVTLLPLGVLYIFSDLIFVILYYFPSYRRDVVSRNLKNAFPEKSDEEIEKIGRKYYKHLSDLFVETLKVMHMSERQISRRFRFRNPELLQSLYDSGRDVLAVCGHYNNWEWLSSMPLHSDFTAMTVYKPLKNKPFDRFMIRLRSKYGVVPSPMGSVLREIIKQRREKNLTVTAFMADQAPRPDENSYWATFLNQVTVFYTGTEKVAVMFDMPVVFVHIIKVKRGYYEAELTLLTEKPKQEPLNAITEMHIRKLEEVIRIQPEYWLWSHKRWKYKKPIKND